MLSLRQALPSKSLNGQVSSCMLVVDMTMSSSIGIAAIDIVTRLLTSDRGATGSVLRVVSIVSHLLS